MIYVVLSLICGFVFVLGAALGVILVVRPGKKSASQTQENWAEQQAFLFERNRLLERNNDLLFEVSEAIRLKGENR